MAKERLASLISGRGSTMETIIRACQSGRIRNIEVGCVISDREGAAGLEIAKSFGISTFVIQLDKLKEVLEQEGITLVTQNGLLKKTPEDVVNLFKGKIFNQHNGSIPDFGGPGMYGRRVIAAQLLFFRLTGQNFPAIACAHHVTNELDRGEVVKSKRVHIFPQDTVDSLEARMLLAEHAVQIDLLEDLSNGWVYEEKLDRIDSSEREILNTCKRFAKLLYPNG